ncbi:MAG: hypothetical protein V1645_04355 [archaeon]
MPKTEPNAIAFGEGLLRILEEKDSPIKSRLEFGKSKTGSQLGYPYIVFLEDLRKLKQYTFPWRFKRINDYTMARRTLSLGLQVMRTAGTQKIFRDTATFSRKEYRTIEGYL